MRKGLKKLVAIVLTATMAFSIGTPAFATMEKVSQNGALIDTTETGILATGNNISVTQEEFDKRRALYQATGNLKTDQEIMDKLVDEKATMFGNRGYIHSRLLPSTPVLTRNCMTGKLSTSGTYYLDFVAIVFINTYNAEISCDTSTF